MLHPARIYDDEDDVNHNNANHSCHLYFPVNDNDTITYSNSYDIDSNDINQVLSEPFLSSHCHPNDGCITICRKYVTTNTQAKTSATRSTWICRTVTIRILYMMIGCLVGRECAIIGSHVFGIDIDHHSLLHFFLRYQYNNSNNNPSPSILLQQYRQYTIVSIILAITWSMSTVLITFLVYQITHYCMVAAMLRRERQRQRPTERKVPPSRFHDMELLPPFDDDDDDDHNVCVDHNGTNDENANQLMITIGTCLGFTIVCFNVM